jgi:hypothetical protein
MKLSRFKIKKPQKHSWGLIQYTRQDVQSPTLSKKSFTPLLMDFKKHRDLSSKK